MDTNGPSIKPCEHCSHIKLPVFEATIHICSWQVRAFPCKAKFWEYPCWILMNTFGLTWSARMTGRGSTTSWVVVNEPMTAKHASCSGQKEASVLHNSLQVKVIAERLSTRLLIVQCDQFTFVCVYIYIYIRYTSIAWGRLCCLIDY